MRTILSSLVVSFITLTATDAGAGHSLLPQGGKDATYTHVHDKFMDVKQRHQAMQDQKYHASILCLEGSELHCGYLKFQGKVDSLRGYEGVELLRKVDALFNRPAYRLDEHLYGQEEYWATPAEFMAHYAGDCEDYALAKYHALKDLGWSEEQMQVVVLWDERARLHHAVLLVSHKGKEWLLDDANNELIESNRVNHYLPLYAVNSQGSAYFHELYAAL